MRALDNILLCFTLVFLFNFSSSDDSQELTPQNDTLSLSSSYKELLNVSYGSDATQVYDIYLPEDRTTDTKTIILVHGSSWISSGDKNDMNGFKDSILKDLPCYAIVNINYRLANENTQPYPMQLNDVTSMINHLKKNKFEYKISENYGFIGISSGAHLSLLWSYTHDIENNINMVASIVGPTNLDAPEYVNSSAPQLKTLITTFGNDASSEYLKKVSPFHQVTTIAPPTILFNGGQDPLVPTNQGISMHAKLTQLNVVHEFTLYPDEGHGWIDLNLFDTWTKLKIFTQKHL